MKIVGIIYAVSLLLLAVMFLLNHKKSIGPIINKGESWYIVAIAILIVILTAPVLVLAFPFVLAKSSKQKKENEQLRTEWDKKQEEEKMQKAKSLERYNETLKTKSDQCDSSIVNVAEQLLHAVNEKNYHSISKILDKVSLPDNTYLEVEECKQEGSGDESKLYLLSLDGNVNYNVFEAIRFDNSCMGAWQAFLLRQIDHYLPRWWHANYGRREYVYSKEELTSIHDYTFDKEQKFPDFSYLDLNPTIFSNGDHYFISCVFWTEFGGLIREYYELVLNNGILSECINFKNDTIYEYNCGIRF